MYLLERVRPRPYSFQYTNLETAVISCNDFLPYTELILQNLTKSFGPKTVLRGLSLTATTGMCVSVLGRNGAGKSTLFNLLK